MRDDRYARKMDDKAEKDIRSHGALRHQVKDDGKFLSVHKFRKIRGVFLGTL